MSAETNEVYCRIWRLVHRPPLLLNRLDIVRQGEGGERTQRRTRAKENSHARGGRVDRSSGYESQYEAAIFSGLLLPL